MGIIDPMLIGNASAGVIQFDGGSLWLALIGAMSGSAVAVAFAAWNQIRAALPPVPRLLPPPVMASGAVSAK
jgi:hypothetical protein